MDQFEFVIPQSRDDLLRIDDGVYAVRELIGEKQIRSKLDEAKQCIKEQGAEFILDNFDTYFSVYYYSEKLPPHVLFLAYQDLHKAVSELVKELAFILSDKESINDELKFKYNKILKMLLYIYVNIVVTIEHKNESKKIQEGIFKEGGRKKTASKNLELYTVDKVDVLVKIAHILQQDIGTLWGDPPIADGVFVETVANVCYRLLKLTAIKAARDVRQEMFHVFGQLIKRYDHGVSFVVSIVQLVKDHEHLAHCVHEGVELLVREYGCRGLIRDIVHEMIDWQTKEVYQDSQGARSCAVVLTNMAAAMSDLMLPEAINLQIYLTDESHTLRNSVLSVITEVILKVLTKTDLTEEHKNCRDELLEVLEEHMKDVSQQVRTKVFQHWAYLQKEDAIPLKIQSKILEQTIVHLADKGALVRKAAANCVTTFLTHNKYGAQLELEVMQNKLVEKRSLLRKKQAELGDEDAVQYIRMEEYWFKHEDDLKKYISDNFSKLSSEKAEDVPEENLSNVVRNYIQNNEYEKALNLCMKASVTVPMWKEMNTVLNDPYKRSELFLVVVHSIFMCTSPSTATATSKGKNTIATSNGSSDDESDTEQNKDTENESDKPPEETQATASTSPGFDPALLEELTQLKCTVDYLEDVVQYLELLNSAISPMSELLISTSVGDMNEATAFFTAASQFGIRNAECGILVMLKVLRNCEPDRKKTIINALKKIYLVTDAKNIESHHRIVCDRLIKLIKKVSYLYVDDLKALIAEWIKMNILDNSIVATLWQYYTRKVDVSLEDSRAALKLLGMAASVRHTIISRNIKLIASIAFADSRKDDLLLFNEACIALCYGASEKPAITDKTTPFRIQLTDPMWQQIVAILVDNFTKKSPFFNEPISAAVALIYKLCSKPERLMEDLLSKVLAEVYKHASEPENGTNVGTQQSLNTTSHVVDNYMLIRLNHLFGCIAIRQLNHLDETIYKEMKRRQYAAEEKKNATSTASKSDKTKGRKNKAQDLNASTASMNSSTRSVNITLRNASAVVNNANSTGATDNSEELMMEGAQADDADAEFIMNLLEKKTVSKSTCLGKLGQLVIRVCERPDIYDDVHLQTTSVIALMRYMLVSSIFCSEHIQLVFTILEKSSHPDVKCGILIHCSDLLERFPNMVEPWSDRIYHRLKDEHSEVRTTTFYILANLILRDMIRVTGDTSKMAGSIVDEDPQISKMAKNFFEDLSRKSNNLHNFIPDIFTHLCADKYSNENVQTIMAFLFGLISKDRTLENLVERFCAKYMTSEEEDVWINVSYCLSLIQYTEKSLRKLVENFVTYKHAIFTDGVYVIFKKIMAACSKAGNPTGNKGDLKALVIELEGKFAEVFELGVDGVPGCAVGGVPATPGAREPVFKKPRTVAPKTAKGRRRGHKPVRPTNNSDDEDDCEGNDNSERDVTPRRSSQRTFRRARGRAFADSDSDSD